MKALASPLVAPGKAHRALKTFVLSRELPGLAERVGSRFSLNFGGDCLIVAWWSDLDDLVA